MPADAETDPGDGLRRLRAEIAEQPTVVARVLAEQREPLHAIAREIRERGPRVVVFVARGSSDNAAVYGRYLFEVCNRTLTSLAAPSTVTLYGRAPRLEEALVIGVSQSGQGEDVVAYVREARAQGAMTLAVVNDPLSPLAQVAARVVDCLAGAELSIPATKTVTAQMTALAALSAALEESGEALDSLAALPGAVAAALELQPIARALATRVAADHETRAVIGRGFAYPTALEIALKLKETSYAQAEPFSAADFFHGPIALVDTRYAALLVDVGGRSSESALQTAAEVRRRGGAAFLVRAGEVDAAATDTPSLTLPARVPEPYAPIPALVLGQLLAVEIALARGYDPAAPRGLRKVTSTR